MVFSKLYNRSCKNTFGSRNQSGFLNRASSGFSLVEVVLALSIIAFALLTLLALLPLGVRSNQISAKETRASFLLTMIEADLRNTDPAAANSSLYNIVELPYQENIGNSDVVEIDTTLVTGTTGAGTYYFDKDEQQIGTGGTVPAGARYRVTIVYTQVPAVGQLTPALARLLVTWPAQIDPLTAAQTSNLQGSVETVVSFPMP